MKWKRSQECLGSSQLILQRGLLIPSQHGTVLTYLNSIERNKSPNLPAVRNFPSVIIQGLAKWVQNQEHVVVQEDQLIEHHQYLEARAFRVFREADHSRLDMLLSPLTSLSITRFRNSKSALRHTSRLPKNFWTVQAPNNHHSSINTKASRKF